jgi:catechol-2,3-dioxygenase
MLWRIQTSIGPILLWCGLAYYTDEEVRPTVKIRHIAISTENPEETAAWYRDVFGLEPEAAEPAAAK